jgi:putative transposase
MKSSIFSETQVARMLKRIERGSSVSSVCRKANISEATFRNWCRRYASIAPSQLQQKELEAENSVLKRLVATLSHDCSVLKRVKVGAD